MWVDYTAREYADAVQMTFSATVETKVVFVPSNLVDMELSVNNKMQMNLISYFIKHVHFICLNLSKFHFQHIYSFHRIWPNQKEKSKK